MDIGREEESHRFVAGFGPAIAGSLLIHAGLLGVVTWMGLRPPSAPALPEPGIQTIVRLIAVNPQRAPLPVELAPTIEAPATEPGQLGGELKEQLAEALRQERLSSEVGLIVEAPPQPLRRGAAPEAAPELDADADNAPQRASTDEPESVGIPQGITRQTLNDSVISFVASTRTGLVRDWVEECQKFKNRQGVSDCRGETDIRSAAMVAQQAGIAALFQTFVETPSEVEDKQVVQETNYLRTLMDENSLVGNLARQRHALFRGTYCLSNGDQQGCAGGSFVSPTGGLMTILTFSITFEGVSMSILGKDISRRFGSAPSSRPVMPLSEQPGYLSAGEDADDNEFRVESPLFPLR